MILHLCKNLAPLTITPLGNVKKFILKKLFTYLYLVKLLFSNIRYTFSMFSFFTISTIALWRISLSIIGKEVFLFPNRIFIPNGSFLIIPSKDFLSLDITYPGLINEIL